MKGKNDQNIKLLLHSILELSAQILLNPKNNFGMSLHICGNENCSKVFVTKHGRGGKPKAKRYCCKEHQQQQDTINAKFRMRDRRGLHGI